MNTVRMPLRHSACRSHWPTHSTKQSLCPRHRQPRRYHSHHCHCHLPGREVEGKGRQLHSFLDITHAHHTTPHPRYCNVPIYNHQAFTGRPHTPIATTAIPAIEKPASATSSTHKHTQRCIRPYLDLSVKSSDRNGHRRRNGGQLLGYKAPVPNVNRS